MRIMVKATGEEKDVEFAMPWNDIYEPRPAHGYSSFTVLNALGEKYFVYSHEADVIRQ